MPIYQYHCKACDHEVELIFRSAARVEAKPKCPDCGARKLDRRMSTFARLKTEADVLAEYGTPGIDGRAEDAYRDPRQIGQWVEQRFEQYGMDVPAETREMIDAARDGELPDAINDI